MTLLIPKTAPLRDPAHLERVRAMPCLVTHQSPSDSHHILMGWHTKGVKPPDDRAVPLIHAQHMRLHQIGEKKFWRELLAQDDLLLGWAMVAFAKSLR
jgi:hypothetical protein